MASVYLLRGCHSDERPVFAMSQADSLALAQFAEEIYEDSLAQAAEREAEYEARQRQWAAEREARYQHQRDSLRSKARSPRAQAYLEDQRRYDSIRALYPKKLAEGTTIDLNLSDSTALKSVPLIGSGRAKQIMYYRERLGGFVAIEQLREIANMPDDVLRWFTLDTSAPVRQLRINRDDFRTLLAHPYLNYEQVKEIMNFRRKISIIKSFSDLRLSTQFTDRDFERLTPYISFE